MKKITDADIKRINELYLQLHTYAAVAREVGCAATTVKKYIIPNYVPEAEIEVRRFAPATDMPSEFSTAMFVGLDNWGELCVLSEEERAEVRELQKEISV